MATVKRKKQKEEEKGQFPKIEAEEDDDEVMEGDYPTDKK